MKVESFELDHRTVIAPYIRKAGVYVGKNKDIVTKFDIRFMQPNKAVMETGAIHTLEHLLAVYLRETELDEKVIDLSPMGCRTGFYFTVWEDLSVEDIKKALVYSLEKVLETTEIPAANEVQCGTYKDHSLEGALKLAKGFLEGINK
ncbi:S-ribosylhomocysteine lyase [Clostridium cylindrosporum]|uniref:S-ribosylhomocysteine lyase n=1 Tax=Clostridium cylindrosporum DSM 605 TaxID=1121307 RepID=A0A0J8D9N6_CLOCY|nr:S-ribosylhomocysteine lyase [Clostridium cylindrosporum]KMT21024.1 S-ribosylhomocysteine lyase LuxS [Clostridium cylindrosporum DSM 605]